MQSSSSLLLNYPDATRREKALIRLLAERAEKVCPGVKVRFVQRDTDGAEILLIVGSQKYWAGNAQSGRRYICA